VRSLTNSFSWTSDVGGYLPSALKLPSPQSNTDCGIAASLIFSFQTLKKCWQLIEEGALLKR
jgi:hypothetical protein